MIRAVINQGNIKPIEPLPADWTEGQELIIDANDPDADLDLADNQRWYDEMRSKTKFQISSHDWLRLQQVLKEMKEESKEQVRREMGL